MSLKTRKITSYRLLVLLPGHSLYCWPGPTADPRWEMIQEWLPGGHPSSLCGRGRWICTGSEPWSPPSVVGRSRWRLWDSRPCCTWRSLRAGWRPLGAGWSLPSPPSTPHTHRTAAMTPGTQLKFIYMQHPGDFNVIFTARQWSCGTIMFSVVCVCLLRGEVPCDIWS